MATKKDEKPWQVSISVAKTFTVIAADDQEAIAMAKEGAGELTGHTESASAMPQKAPATLPTVQTHTVKK